METILNGIWQYKGLLIALLVIALLISVWGMIKKHALVVLICLLLVGGNSAILVGAWNSLNSAASTVITEAGDIAEEEGIYNREKAQDFGDKAKQFFKDLVK